MTPLNISPSVIQVQAGEGGSDYGGDRGGGQPEVERDDGGGEAALLRNGLFMFQLFIFIVSCLFTFC